jgi:hypothetical protein
MTVAAYLAATIHTSPWEYLGTTASEYVPPEILPPRSKDAESLDPSETKLQSNRATVIPQHPIATNWRTSHQGLEFTHQPDIESALVLEDAQATHLLLENGFDIYAVSFNPNVALL